MHVQPKQTLALLGGDVVLEGGTVKTPGGRIELGSVGANSFVSLTPISKGFALGYDSVSTFKEIQLSQQTDVDASGAGGGDIQVRGSKVTLTDGSQIEASTLRDESGGTLNVTASDVIEVAGISSDGNNNSALLSAVYPNATGAGSNLSLTTRQLIIRDGASVYTKTYNQGSGGNLMIRASDLIEVIGLSKDNSYISNLSATTQRGTTGHSGNITIETGRLIVRDGAFILTDTYNDHPGGSLTIKANNSVELSGTHQSVISTVVRDTASRTAVYTQINLAQSLICLKQQGMSQIELQKASPIVQQCYSQVKDKSTTQSEITIAWSEIAQLLARAVQQSRTLQDAQAEAYALGYLGGLYQETKQWSTAEDLTKQALFLAQAINAPDITYRWQWQLGRLLNATGKTTEARAFYTEAVNTLKSLRNDLASINPEVQFSFRDSVEPVYRELVSLLLEGGENEPSQQNLVQARAAIESLQLAELNNFFRFACLEGKPVQIDRVIDRDDRTAAVIYPIILADRLEVILKLPQQPLLHYKTFVTQSEVERIAEDLRDKITKPYTLNETRSLSNQIYNWLIQPALPYLAKSKIQTLVFVLDGELRNIPMAALYDGKKYLVENYSVALTPGLQLLPSKSRKRELLKALIGGITAPRQGFSALTNVASELEQIKSQLPGTTELLDGKFTNTTLQKEISSLPFPIVHLATHGQFSSRLKETFGLGKQRA